MQESKTKISAPIKERVRMYLKVKGLRVRDFLEATGVSESNFKSKYSEFGGEVIAEILSAYGDISPYWLILGQGEMLQAHRPLIEIGNIRGDNNVYGDSNAISPSSPSQDALQQSQLEQIRILEEQIRHLKTLLSKRDEQMDQVLKLLSAPRKEEEHPVK